MRKVAQVITCISGRRNKKGYRVLCQVIEAALQYMPEERPLGALCEEVGRPDGIKGETVYKALARVTQDIWENGDRQELERTMGYRLWEEPSPKEMVMALVQTMWYSEAHVEYHLLEGGLEKKVGIWAKIAGEKDYAAMAPFSRNREAVSQMVDRWNREQMPIQRFKDMILLGQLRDE